MQPNEHQALHVDHPLFEQMRQLRELLVMYSCAIREVRTKLEVLSEEFEVRQNRNPIESIKSRVKDPESIIRKLSGKGLEPTLAAMVESLGDIAGIRVVCPFVDDIYFLAHTLLAQDDITLIEREDYIAVPKPSGYRSLHLVVEIPVFFSDEKRGVRVEVQIRTIGMNFWASLEHEIRYKRHLPDSRDIVQELKECADTIWETDLHMQEIHRRLRQQDD